MEDRDAPTSAGTLPRWLRRFVGRDGQFARRSLRVGRRPRPAVLRRERGRSGLSLLSWASLRDRSYRALDASRCDVPLDEGAHFLRP